MKKPPVNEEQLTSELGGSAFFRSARENTQGAEPTRENPSQAVAGIPIQEVSTGRTPRTRRRTVRTPFDIYDDQADALRALSLEERMTGGLGSMSAMVREALDAYIGKRRRGGRS